MRKTNTYIDFFCLDFPGDILDTYTKEQNGWWFGKLNGKTGHFPSAYVEELHVSSDITLPDNWPPNKPPNKSEMLEVPIFLCTV